MHEISVSVVAYVCSDFYENNETRRITGKNTQILLYHNMYSTDIHIKYSGRTRNQF